MSDKEIVRFYKEDLYDFKPFILPNVFEQLLLTESFDEQMLICAGALEDGAPAGAVIAQLLEDNEIYIHSIYVDKNFRRMGLGTELINGVLREIFDYVTGENSIKAYPTRVFIHADYALPEGQLNDFEAFLKAFGFTDYYEMERCCYIESRLPAGHPDRAVPVKNLAEGSVDYADEFSSFLTQEGLNINTDNAFYIPEKDGVKAVIAAEYGMDDEYYVRSFSAGGGDVSPAEFEAMFTALYAALEKESGSFVIVTDGSENINNDFLEDLAGKYGEIYIHKEAGCYAEFNPLEEQEEK